MARITVEDCLTKETNRFGLVQLSAKRTKQLLSGARPLISDTRGNKSVVVSLREIADGKVRFMSEEEARLAKEQEQAEREKLFAEGATAVVPTPTGELAALIPSSVTDVDDDDDDDEDETPPKNGKSPSAAPADDDEF